MKGVITVLLIFVSFAGFAQVKISGRLTDNKNKALAGASITIKNSYDGTTSDSLGNFSFITTEKGAHIIEASLSGYNSYEKNITINKEDIVLNISVKELITDLQK